MELVLVSTRWKSWSEDPFLVVCWGKINERLPQLQKITLPSSAPGKIFWPHTPANTGYVRIHCGISEEKAKQKKLKSKLQKANC